MARKIDRGADVHGILLLDKPRGLTSNEALQAVKRLYGANKAGHTGTLDPLATGMLPICFGAATRVSSYLLTAAKSYLVTAELGRATDTGDSTGATTASTGRIDLDRDAVQATMNEFLGDIDQIPPMYSALKQDGRRLYDLARRGVEVERSSRRVRIDTLEATDYDWPTLRFAVTCSKGTYVRTLVEDVAAGLGTVAHVTALRRTEIEPFDEADLVSMSELEEHAADGPERLTALLRPVDSVLTRWPKLVVGEEAGSRLSHGQAVRAESGCHVGWVRLYDSREVFFGIGEVDTEGELAPRRIFPGLSPWI